MIKDYGREIRKQIHANELKSKITAEQFEKYTGRSPIDDDLERVNCPHVGKPGHSQCGWNYKRNLPVFEVGSE